MKKILIILILCSSSYCFSQVAPVANDDTVTTPLLEDGASGVVSILTNDTDADGSPAPTSGHNVDLDPAPGVQITYTDAQGTWMYDPISGVVTFDPSTNFWGFAELPYSLCDASGLCDFANITFTVTAVNDAPFVSDDTVTSVEDTPVYIPVTANDVDLESPIDVTSITIIVPPTNGTVVFDPVTGAITYTPNPSFCGIDSFVYQVCDTGLPLPVACNTATVTVTINCINDGPVANDDTVFTPLTEDGAIGTVSILVNDSDNDGNPTVTSGHTVDLDPTIPGDQNVIVTIEGTWTYDVTTGIVTFDPASNFNGVATLPYMLCDAGTPVLCDFALITFTVNPVNDAPILANDGNVTNENTPVTGDITTSADTDPDGTPLVLGTIPISGPAHGTIVIQPDGSYVYTPNPGFVGVDVITVQVCDSGTPLPAQCANQTLTITVNPLNGVPIANDDAVTTQMNSTVVLGVLTNDYGSINPTTVTITSTPSNGTASINPTTGEITYLPSTNFTGTDTFMYQVCDSNTPAQCDTAIVTVTLTNSSSPIANDDTGSIVLVEDGANGTVNILTNDTDANGNPTPTSGHIVDLNPSVSGIQSTITTSLGIWTYNTTSGIVTFDPVTNFNGTASISYSLCNTTNLCDNANITFTVNPVNDAPVANNDTATTQMNTPVLITVLSNDTDLDGTIDLTNLTITVQPTNGSVMVNPSTGVVTYTPNLNFNGTDSFTYQVCDNGTPLPALCDTAIVTINLSSINLIANNDISTFTYLSLGSIATINILQNDTANGVTVLPTSEYTIDLDTSQPGIQHTITTYAGTWSYDVATGIVSITFFNTFQGGTTGISYALRHANGASNTAYASIIFNVISPKIVLIAFIDTNNNGVKDAGESNFTFGHFQYFINNSGTIYGIGSSDGVSTIYDTNISNTYDFSFNFYSNYASYYSSITLNDITPTLAGLPIYFPITINNNYTDVAVYNQCFSWAIPGFSYYNALVLKNNGTQTIASGTLTFTKDPAVSIYSISPPATTITGTGFTYNFSNLLPFETRFITVNMLVPTIPTVAIGQQLYSNASVTLQPNETTFANNSSSLTQTIIGAYDPNDKTEHHGGPIVHSTFTSEDYLTYTIRFENTGTANAEFVKVEDTLDAKLDENSLEMIDSDHTCTLERTGNAMVWKFYDINLPPSVPDSSIGHGYITFRIKPKPGYAIGDIIENTAQIYFDTNPAIVTNTYQTEFVTTLRIDDFSSNDLKVYPNPVEDIVQLSFNNGDEKKIEIFNCLGVLLTTKTVSSDFMSFDFSGYTSGVYFVKCSMDNALIQTVKVVKK